MHTENEVTVAQAQQQLVVKMVVDAWRGTNQRVDKLVDSLTDEQMLQEVAPGRNTGVYLLGHIAAVNDGLLALMGWGERLYPEMEDMFLRSPDKSGKEFPLVTELKHRWHTINNELEKHISTLKPEDWFARHMSVSPEDFEKEPHRNRLNVLMGRTIHQSNHLGQMLFLAGKNE